LLKGEKIEVYEKDLSFLFEAIAGILIESPFWFDGAVGLTARIKKKRQVIFEGKIWTAKDAQKQWLENFEAIVTDKRITKQGLWIKIRVGDYVDEGDILEVL
jgi:hypothetical protein